MELRRSFAALVALLSTAACASNTPRNTVQVMRVRTIESHERSPEPCVDPIAHAERMNGMLDEEGRPYYAPEGRAFDLDGDGSPDPVLAADRDATTTRYEIYLVPRGCGRYVGGARVEGRVIGTLQKTSHGLRVLEMVGPCDDTCAETPHFELRFDGNSWVIGDRWTVPKK